MTISHIVGSTVRSITRVSARPPSVRPISSRRFARLAGRARVSDRVVQIPRQLLGLPGRDAARPQLVERDVAGEQLVDRIAPHGGTVYRDGPTDAGEPVVHGEEDPCPLARSSRGKTPPVRRERKRVEALGMVWSRVYGACALCLNPRRAILAGSDTRSVHGRTDLTRSAP